MIHIKKFVKYAINEDNGRGDLFYDIAPEGKFTSRIISKSDGVLAGVKYAEILAQTEKIKIEFLKKDGERIYKGDVLATLEGRASKLLSSERTFLNMLQHASGIATMASRFAKKLENYNVVLLDTRKTRPHLRDFEKYASRIGGAINHRLGLDDCLMLKDTHLRTIVDLKEFIKKARKRISWVTKIEIECETFEQVEKAMEAGADIIMCDNMDYVGIREVVAYRNEKYPHILLEASGNINLDTIQEYASTGVDAVSSGSIIHQATWLDFSMRVD
ncbi:putative nicotinate-nucleotide pyrophosphorylase (carboxylating) [Aliarcobacter thereius]|uniref:nicotinate-nucleotide diphosphorylase (carboxylating) n=2 Tax=Aliarcobacter thereius TaxID=544718 RepID=A0A1C0B9I2_9BACT|nr:carboxylating nicotinate-nucleotide diphosphorylase [Aliarcobacter thereius]OCL88635.1 putative nicotinate-nucleotide pyrophosphorylase (carboxylating) [Aliarcobacter thereius]OCL92130.1 putative nicotinate-nucleotide pyrophosphorylase (carboxylating) [Aliarcobacter thereius]OCL94774.1 putative nicotinate-nucleotide pyrophosphorylase [carboxylating] [Aliarcobacter thereius LMG 24486]OCM00222.1 putative nicotinate-nucleotide pyrophosphorylase (carboxylating) [Aliarcobacter thereius]QBF15350.